MRWEGNVLQAGHEQDLCPNGDSFPIKPCPPQDSSLETFLPFITLPPAGLVLTGDDSPHIASDPAGLSLRADSSSCNPAPRRTPCHRNLCIHITPPLAGLFLTRDSSLHLALTPAGLILTGDSAPHLTSPFTGLSFKGLFPLRTLPPAELLLIGDCSTLFPHPRQDSA